MDKSVGIKEVFLTLATQQLDVVVAFYSDILGVVPQQHRPQRYAEFLCAGYKLAFFQAQPGNWQEFDAPGSGAMSLCIEVTHLPAAIAHLTRLGYPPTGTPITASHGREIYARDPDGNRLILHQSSGASEEA